MSLRITKLHGNVTKIEVGHWIITQAGEDGQAIHTSTREFFSFDRGMIDDLIEGMKVAKDEMIREHHG